MTFMPHITSIPKKREKPRRTRPELFRNHMRDLNFLDARSYVTKGGRYRLFGEDYSQLRVQAEQRAYYGDSLKCFALCECGCGKPAPWNGDLASTGELSHNEHGARKSDELHRVKWMRHECHMKSHNCNGKPVKSKT